ncbi:MAG TPA: cytochrome c [Aggregatilineales bacterium]|nr:cytochrome c [Aggregatilineales bacterium]
MHRKALFFLLILILAACKDDKSKIPYRDLPPEGDPVNGVRLFNMEVNRAAACSACHSVDGTDTGTPSLKGFAARAGERVAGQDAREYTFYSIVEPGRHIVDDFGNAMYDGYDEKMTAQQIADIIAYLLRL